MEMITKVTFGKDRFHQQEEMIRWCKQNIGDGGWSQSLTQESKKWRVDSMFGNTDFWFKEEKDYLLFCLKWM